jgi:fructose-1,6-bisphosphatase/inositol monophosphatase family enzyme
MLKKIAIVAILAFVGYGLFTLGDVKGTASFKGKLDSLTEANDYLLIQNQIADSQIEAIERQDSIYIHDLENRKARVVKIKEYVQVEVNKIDNFSEQEIVSYLNQRYPKDTITNPLPVAQPVLTFVAKDLAAYDGAKHEIVIKDSVIAIQESRITLKDSTIGLYANKEIRFKSIISNQDLKINQWSKQYDMLNLNYKKLQVKNKFQKIGSYIIIGGLTYALLAK